MNRHRPLISYLILVTVACLGFVWAARRMGQTVNMVAAIYMLTPAISALIVRAFIDERRFDDAGFSRGRLRDYLVFWLFGIGIALFNYVAYSAVGAVSWDLSGQGFFKQLESLAPGQSEKLIAQLPAGMSVQGMLIVYSIAGLTVMNIPGMILGFGEEFGWRGFMFPRMLRINRWTAFIVGGLIWYAWHTPLALLMPPGPAVAASHTVIRIVALAVGSIATFSILAYCYAKSGNIWVPSLFHITINNASRSFSYWIIVKDQMMADVALSVSMVIVAAVLFARSGFEAFRRLEDGVGAGR